MSKPPRTFAEDFYLEASTFMQRRRRDLRLISWLWGNVAMWYKARNVRREFERCRRTGEPFYVDRFTPPWAKR